MEGRCHCLMPEQHVTLGELMLRLVSRSVSSPIQSTSSARSCLICIVERQVSVNEALVWRLVEVWNRLDLAGLSKTGDDQQVQANTDTPVQISLVYCSDLTAAVRLVLPPSASMPMEFLSLDLCMCHLAQICTLRIMTRGSADFFRHIDG